MSSSTAQPPTLEGFTERVLRVVRQVPAGRVTTYGDVAAAAGAPRSARQVGYVMARSGDVVPEVPWHRVINAQGRISGRGDLWRADEQQHRLEDEGETYVDSGQVELHLLRWFFTVD